MIRRWLTLVAILVAVAAQTLFAQEQTTDAEQTYRELHKSPDTKTQLLAERWYNAVKLQKWTSKSGKFTTTAKYLEHDPNLAWVKLRIITGSGDQRVVKDVTVPLAELDKVCQSRVRQISILAEKVIAAAAAEKEKEKESTEPSADGAAGAMPEGGLMADEQRGVRNGRDGLAGMDAEQALTEGGRTRRPRPARTAARRPSPPATSNAPLTALLPPLPSDRALLGHSPSTPDAPQAEPIEHRGP